MASFWRVTRDGDGSPMVMKIPLLRPGEDPLTIIGYEVEQMILPRLAGRHTPGFIAAGDFDRPYIVMEFIAGASVKSFLARVPLPPDEVAMIGARIAFALHDIHRQHVIHLDLKPSNVILRGEDAVLIDFGLSRHDQLPDLVQEEAEGPVGTGAYISPEQVLGQRSDPRSDLFSLGVILYFLAGERPFGEPQGVNNWRRRLWRGPAPPRARNAAVPPGCRRSSCGAWEPIRGRVMPRRPSSPLTFNTRTRCPSPRAPPGCDTTTFSPSFGVGSASVASPNARALL